MAKVEFVSYTGSYPCLCSGVLTVKIDGETVRFGHEVGSFDYKTSSYKDNNYDDFWVSGGSVECDGNEEYYTEQEKWEISIDNDFPYNNIINELIDCMNENVRYGCCGGCI